MDTKTRVIEITRVERQNSSGSDVRHEELFDGKPKHIPGYTLIGWSKGWKVIKLQNGDSVLTFSYVKFLNILPLCVWPRRYTNVGGKLIESMWRKPVTALSVYEISDRP